MAKQRRRGSQEVLRARHGQAFWGKAVEEWLKSGLTRAEFCAPRGLKASTLTWWRWRLVGSGSRRAKAQAQRRSSRRAARVVASSPAARAAVSPAAFLPVTILSGSVIRGDDIARVSAGVDARGVTIEVVLRSGLRICVPSGFDAVTLARVVQVLEHTPC